MIALKDFLSVLQTVLKRPVDGLDLHSIPSDVDGWDSLNHILLIIQLESTFGVKFSTSAIRKWSCVGDIIRDINELRR